MKQPIIDLSGMPENPLIIGRDRFTELLAAEQQRDTFQLELTAAISTQEDLRAEVRKWRIVADGLAEKQKKIIAWIDRLIAQSDKQAKDNTGRFESLADASRKDAASLRKTKEYISAAIAAYDAAKKESP